MQVHLANGSMRASNRFVQNAQVMYEEHAEFLDFHMMKLPKYDAILGKSWLDRWNPSIHLRVGTISIQVGKKTVRAAISFSNMFLIAGRQSCVVRIC